MNRTSVAWEKSASTVSHCSSFMRGMRAAPLETNDAQSKTRTAIVFNIYVQGKQASGEEQTKRRAKGEIEKEKIIKPSWETRGLPTRAI